MRIFVCTKLKYGKDGYKQTFDILNKMFDIFTLA